jgi:hypothetical protein
MGFALGWFAICAAYYAGKAGTSFSEILMGLTALAFVLGTFYDWSKEKPR